MKHTHRMHPRSAQRGVVLISAILLLVVMTLLALAMFKSFGIQELIAGNVREKQRAVQSAEAAEQYGEIWLSSLGNVLSNNVDCSSLGLVAYTTTGTPYICQKPVAAIDDALNVTTVPWTIGGAEVGFAFFPGAVAGTGDLTVSTTGGIDAYYQVPRLYISWLGFDGVHSTYRIDAWNYGGTTSTAAVVEGNYVVTCTTC
jgi:type IV pilus assembly protein PilX